MQLNEHQLSALQNCIRSGLNTDKLTLRTATQKKKKSRIILTSERAHVPALKRAAFNTQQIKPQKLRRSGTRNV